MRILFDRGTHRPLRHQTFGHNFETCQENGWDSKIMSSVVGIDE